MDWAGCEDFHRFLADSRSLSFGSSRKCLSV
jgi:hypothetical protein